MNTKIHEATSAAQILGAVETTAVKKTRTRTPVAKKAPRKVNTTTLNESVDSQKPNIVLTKIENASRFSKDMLTGMGLSFLGNLPNFLDPIGFLFFNAHKIGLGLLHLLMPLLIAGAIAYSNSTLFAKSTSLSLEGAFLAISLYAFGSFIWTLTWLFTRTVGCGIGKVFKDFAKVGEQKK